LKAAPFEYLLASTVGEAVSALAESGGEGKILAGGQSLVPLLALRMARPQLLVDINRIPGLDDMSPNDGPGSAFRVGALTRHSRLADQSHHPLLAAAARFIGHPAIRTRGTAGGSLAHADPVAELPVAAVALDAVVQVSGPGGHREVAAADLYAGMFQTTLAEDEMITAIDWPVPSRWGFSELARRHGDFGLVTVVAAEVAGRWQVAVGGVAGTVHRAVGAEAVLSDASAGGPAITRAAAAAAAGVEPTGDIHGSAAYRRALTGELTRRALLQATSREAA
jgi:carbon-monoxide dehydrogenase medium subunit